MTATTGRRHLATGAAGIAATLALLVAGCGSGDAQPEDGSAPTTATTAEVPSEDSSDRAASEASADSDNDGTADSDNTASSDAAGDGQPRPSTGCSTSAAEPPLQRIDLDVGDTRRAALVRVPSGAADTDPLPLVVSFHGASGSAALQQATDGLDALADTEGFVVVYPEGLEVGLNQLVTGITGWDPHGRQVDEAAFVTALLDEVESQVCIDQSRVFATGFSAGAYLALVVSCDLPERFAAVALVGAAYQSNGCPSADGLPTLVFHGIDDLVTPFAGRSETQAGTFLPVPEVLEAQAVRNGCLGDPDRQAVHATIDVVTWVDCQHPTVLYELGGHGHAWPGRPMQFTEQLLAGVLAGGDGQAPDPLMVAIGATPESMAANVLLTNVEVDATALILDFFGSSL